MDGCTKGYSTKDECYAYVRERKQKRLDELDALMVAKFYTSQDYARLKRRKELLLRRIEVLASRLYLSQGNIQ